MVFHFQNYHIILTKKIKQIINVTKRFYKNFSEEKFNKLCQMFDLDVNKKLEELSSGMKVKYSLAVALSYNARLLILDEPTSGLDPISRDEILEIFLSIIKNKDRGILFSTHITSDLDKCATHIVYIHDGKIVYKGTKIDFINAYKIIKSKNDLSDNEFFNKFISFKNHDNNFEGLIHSEDARYFKNIDNVEILNPDLEEIMIYLERGKENEKFDL